MIVCILTDGIGVACERARAAALIGEPVALVADGALSVVSAEAATFGVRVGQAATFARTLCRGLIVLPYDRDAYMKASEAIWDAIAVETSTVEPVSPEVTFAELIGTGIPDRAKALAAAIEIASGADVRVGLSSSKLVAELAARRNTSGNVVVATGRESALLEPARLASLSKVPVKVRIKADKLGIRTLGDVLRTPVTELERQFRTDALLLRRLAVGEDGDTVKALCRHLRYRTRCGSTTRCATSGC